MAQVKALIGNIKGKDGEKGKDGSENQIYSYDETPIGTWVDGKPLYRKCFNYTSSDRDTEIANLSSLNVDTVCNIYGTRFYYSDGESFQSAVNVAHSNSYWSVGYYRNENKTLRLNTNEASSGVIIIEYTKTTD